MNQQLAIQISLHAMALVALAFIYVALNAKFLGDAEAIAPHSARLRKQVFWLLSAGLVLVGWLTLDDLPQTRAGRPVAGGAPQIVSVVAGQWQWDIRPSKVRTGQPVIFQVTSADVNHNFAIYNPAMRLVAQTQAMPGYVNRLRHSFDEPGLYRILCLEYCGPSHHRMAAEIEVTGERR